MNETITETMNYFYVIHGVPPELFPNVAYRRSGQAQRYKRKIIKCPYCTERLTDVNIDTKVELYRYPERLNIACHIYQKCESCGKEVGIRLV